ncbi:DUF4365 domain-containing protein [Agromyces sp. NPDC058126]|uniref:DUF4365 domain-containing protein n=1 Tax=Agromyces sp. NPDC058126 TaxID=3346350 RepID=UPI0036DB120B
MAILQDAVLQEGWAFREQRELDYGVDAHAELIDDQGPTGRLLAIQIKSGPSQFDRPTDGGWFYPVSAKHAKYWLDYSLPVVLVLVDVEERAAYWVSISDAVLLSTGKNFKVLVPTRNRVDGARVEWERLVDRAAQDAMDSYEDNLQLLPPVTLQAVEVLRQTDESAAAMLVTLLAGLRNEPEKAIERASEIVGTERSASATASTRVLCNFAQAHELALQAAELMLDIAQRDPVSTSGLLARAALQLKAVDEERGRNLITDASNADPVDDLAVAVARASYSPGLLDEESELFEPAVARTLYTYAGHELVQRYRGTVAAMAGSPIEAIEHLESALNQSPKSDDLKLLLADQYIHATHTAEAPTDLSRAEALARDAGASHRMWKPYSTESGKTLVRILGLQSRFDEALVRTLPVPQGIATAEESADEEFARLGAITAELLGRRDELNAIVERVQPAESRDRLRRRFADLSQMDTDAQLEWKRSTLAELPPDGWAERVAIALELAAEGLDESASLQAGVDAGIILPHLAELSRTIAASVVNPHSLESLRRMSRTDRTAAGALVKAEIRVGEWQKALTDTRRAFAVFGGAEFVRLEVDALLASDREEDAEARMRVAVDQRHVNGEHRKQYLFDLGGRAADREDWEEASARYRLAAEKSKEFGSSDSAAWNLIVCHLKEGDFDRARRALRDFEPAVSSDEQAGVWLEVHNQTGWDAPSATRALGLALETDDAQLATALVASVIHFTRGVGGGTSEDADAVEDSKESSLESRTYDMRPAVPGDLHRQAFELLDKLISRHGAGAVQLKVMHSDNDTDLVSELVELARPTEPQRALARGIELGVFPVGLAASLQRKSYSMALLGRNARVASTLEPHTHEAENGAALAAFGSTVVADLSAVFLAEQLGVLELVRDQFLDIEITRSSRNDARRGVEDARTATAAIGHLRVFRGQPVFEEVDPVALRAQFSRASNLYVAARSLTVVPDPNGHSELTRVRENLGDAPWLDCLDYAENQRIAVWSDDLAQRNVARALGLAAFGTVNLLEALALAELGDSPTAEATAVFIEKQVQLLEKLTAHRVVDQPVSVGMLKAMIASGSNEGAIVLTRPGWWILQGGIDAWFELRDALAAGDTSRAQAWLYCAMRGVASMGAADAEASLRHVTVLALLGLSGSPSPAQVRSGIEIAEFVSDEYELGDPKSILAEVIAALASDAAIGDPASFLADVLGEAIAGEGLQVG